MNSVEKLIERGRQEGQQAVMSSVEKLIERGRQEGRQEGEARGEAFGLQKGKREALLAIIDARSLHLTEQQRDRIAACEDLADLQQWLVKAVTATTPDDIFA
jgi:predicted transposase YdaD